MCTGLAATPIEPNTPTVTEKFQHLHRLISYGFPASQIVLRVDPLFPLCWVKAVDDVCGIDYIRKLEAILAMAENLGIRRVRYSYLNLYDFTLSRLQQISHEFTVPQGWVPDYRSEIQLDRLNGDFEFEACAEFLVPPAHRVPCVSEKDLKALKLHITHELTFGKAPSAGDPACMCPVNKVELLAGRRFKCGFGCQYCYWRPAKIDLAKEVIQ